jgi:hypothetical protein
MKSQLRIIFINIISMPRSHVGVATVSDVFPKPQQGNIPKVIYLLVWLLVPPELSCDGHEPSPLYVCAGIYQLYFPLVLGTLF